MAESNQTTNIVKVIKIDQSLSKYEEYFKGFSDIGIKLDDLVESFDEELAHQEEDYSISNAVTSNPILTLQAQLGRFTYRNLRADQRNIEAKTGITMYKDLHRMKFIINGKEIDQDFVASYKKENFYLITNAESKDYRSFLVKAFTEIFRDAGATVPNDSIMQELITNCNQAGYEAALYVGVFRDMCIKHNLIVTTPKKTMRINCMNPNYIKVKSNMIIPLHNSSMEDTKVLNSALEFILKSDGHNVDYSDGKLSLNIPKSLENFHVNTEEQHLGSVDKEGNTLLDTIIEYFLILLEKTFDVNFKDRKQAYNIVKNEMYMKQYKSGPEAVVIKDIGINKASGTIQIESDLGENKLLAIENSSQQDNNVGSNMENITVSSLQHSKLSTRCC